MPRAPRPPHLLKIPYNTRLPRWLCEWLSHPDRAESGAVMIELALRSKFKAAPPKLHQPNH